MAKNFDLSRVRPETDTFTDVDGKTYEVRSSLMLSPREKAAMQRLTNGVVSDMKTLEKGDNERISDLVLKRTRKMIGLLVPSMPAKRLDDLTSEQMDAFMEWWGHVNGEAREERLAAPAIDGDDDIEGE